MAPSKRPEAMDSQRKCHLITRKNFFTVRVTKHRHCVLSLQFPIRVLCNFRALMYLQNIFWIKEIFLVCFFTVKKYWFRMLRRVHWAIQFTHLEIWRKVSRTLSKNRSSTISSHSCFSVLLGRIKSCCQAPFYLM